MSGFFKSRPDFWLWRSRDSWKAMANSTRGGLEGKDGQGPLPKGHFICAHPASKVWQSLTVRKWPDCSMASHSLSLLPERVSVVLHWCPLCCPCQQLPQGHEEGPGEGRAGRTVPDREDLLPPTQPGAGQVWGWGQAGWDMTGSMAGQGRAVGSWSCSISEAGADGLGGLKWGPGPWLGWGESPKGWARTIRAMSVLMMLILKFCFPSFTDLILLYTPL